MKTITQEQLLLNIKELLNKAKDDFKAENKTSAYEAITDTLNNADNLEQCWDSLCELIPEPWAAMALIINAATGLLPNGETYEEGHINTQKHIN